jgi:hypothetical protein
MTIGDESTDDDDLDSLPADQAQIKNRKEPRGRAQIRDVTPQASYPLNPISSPPTARPAGRAFRIGGKSKQQTPASSPPPNDAITIPAVRGGVSVPPPDPESSQIAPEAEKPLKKQRFKIGGRAKAGTIDGSPQTTNEPSTTTRSQLAQFPIIASSPPPIPVKEEPQSQVEQAPEETTEEKAERKRAELKRRMEEAAKKQAQGKKKKRF